MPAFSNITKPKPRALLPLYFHASEVIIIRRERQCVFLTNPSVLAVFLTNLSVLAVFLTNASVLAVFFMNASVLDMKCRLLLRECWRIWAFKLSLVGQHVPVIWILPVDLVYKPPWELKFHMATGIDVGKLLLL